MVLARCARCERSMTFFLSLSACFSIFPIDCEIDWYMSGELLVAVRTSFRQLSVISHRWRARSTSKMTWALMAFPSNTWSIFLNCSSAWDLSAGVTSICLPVYSIIIVSPFSIGQPRDADPHCKGPCLDHGLPLTRTGNAHLVAIFRDRSPRQLNPFLAQDLCDLFVGKWVLRVFFLNELLDPEFED